MSSIQNTCNIIPIQKNEIKFAVHDVPQALKKDYAGLFAAAFTYLILKGKTVSCCARNQALLPDQLINFLEFSIYIENILTECGTFSHPTSYISFTERLYCHCMKSDIGELV